LQLQKKVLKCFQMWDFFAFPIYWQIFLVLLFFTCLI